MIKDTVKVKGYFTLKIFKNNELVETYEDKNLVVSTGRVAIARLIGITDSGGDPSDFTPSKIGFGTNATAASPSDTALVDSFEKAIEGITYPISGMAAIAWTLAEDEANGKAIAEFGLITGSDTLFARKVRDVINKTSDTRLEGVWKIIF